MNTYNIHSSQVAPKHRRRNPYTMGVWFILAASVLFGLYNLISSSYIAYQIKDIEKSIIQINHEIAVQETTYQMSAKEIEQADTLSTMVAYSSHSNQLRYARVGKAVYTLATR